MNNKKTLLILLIIGFISCINHENKSDNLEIAKQFYMTLDNSNASNINKLITDSFTTIDDGFEQKYSGNEYTEWVKWDSVFQPTYEILKIEKDNEIVKATIFKTDKRIAFLHREPIITNEIIQFEGNKIKHISRSSVSFNVEVFVKNRDELVNWIAINNPELNGFIYDQTKSGAINYLKAIDMYKKRK